MIYNIGYMWWLLLALKINQVQAVDLPTYTASPSAPLRTSPSAKPLATPTVILPTSTPKAIPFISGRVDCGELVVLSGNESVAPAKVAIQINSSGNLSEVKGYKVDWGDKITRESTSPNFNYTYTSPGTYEVKGYVQDRMGLTYGGQDECLKTVKILAASPLTTQPKTGVSDTAWMAIGVMLVSAMIMRKYAKTS